MSQYSSKSVSSYGIVNLKEIPFKSMGEFRDIRVNSPSFVSSADLVKALKSPVGSTKKDALSLSVAVCSVKPNFL